MSTFTTYLLPYLDVELAYSWLRSDSGPSNVFQVINKAVGYAHYDSVAPAIDGALFAYGNADGGMPKKSMFRFDGSHIPADATNFDVQLRGFFTNGAGAGYAGISSKMWWLNAAGTVDAYHSISVNSDITNTGYLTYTWSMGATNPLTTSAWLYSEIADFFAGMERVGEEAFSTRCCGLWAKVVYDYTPAATFIPIVRLSP